MVGAGAAGGGEKSGRAGWVIDIGLVYLAGWRSSLAGNRKNGRLKWDMWPIKVREDTM